MNSDNIKFAIEQFPIERFNGVNSITVRPKIIDGVETDKTAIVFGVDKKLDSDKVTQDQLIPEIIEVDDQQIITDVVEDQTDWQFENTGMCPSITEQQLNEHRMKHRPLIGGVSIGIDTQEHRTKVATMGLIVRDSLDGQLVGLTNNHVVSPDLFTTANMLVNTMYNYKDVQVMQPARAEAASAGYPMYEENVVGDVKRVYPIYEPVANRNNLIDAAIFNITDDGYTSMVDSTSGSLLGLNGEPVTIATTSEIDNLDSGVSLFKSSRTTGAFGSVESIEDAAASNECSLRIYDSLPAGRRRVTGRYFIETFAYYDPTPGSNLDPSKGGDSGSIVCARIDNQWKAVGLHFAGGRNNGVDYGLACRMDNVAELLQIESIGDGDLNHGQTSPKYHVEPQYSGQWTRVIDGKIYWQVGRTADATLG